MRISLEFLSELPQFKMEKPYEIFMQQIPAGLPKTNCEYSKHSNIQIRDVRATGKTFTLDDFGFTFLPATGHPAPTTKEFESEDSKDVVLHYLEETISFVARHVKADRILCFDWRVRSLS